MDVLGPGLILYDEVGVALAVKDGLAIPANTPGLLLMGSDSGTARYLFVDSTGRASVVSDQLPASLVGGRLDVVVGAALPAGTNNIGDVDILSVPAPLSTTGGGTEAAALRVTIASDSTGLVSVDDNGGSLTVDSPQLPAALVGGRLDQNIGAWFGSTAPTVGQKAMSSAVPVTVASDQSPIFNGLRDPNNSTATPLGASGVFTGTYTKCEGYSRIAVNVVADASTTFNGVRVYWASDALGTDEYGDDQSYEHQGSLGWWSYAFEVRGPYFKLEWENAGAPQSVFSLVTILQTSDKVTALDNIHVLGRFSHDSGGTTGATNLGVLSALASAAAPTYGEGNGVKLSTDLSGALRVTGAFSSSGAALDAANSTSTPLGGNATFNGSAFSPCVGWHSIHVYVLADQDSQIAPLGVSIQWATDSIGTNAIYDSVQGGQYVSTPTPEWKRITFAVKAPYFRIEYNNDVAAQGLFSLQTVLSLDPVNATLPYFSSLAIDGFTRVGVVGGVTSGDFVTPLSLRAVGSNNALVTSGPGTADSIDTTGVLTAQGIGVRQVISNGTVSDSLQITSSTVNALQHSRLKGAIRLGAVTGAGTGYSLVVVVREVTPNGNIITTSSTTLTPAANTTYELEHILRYSDSLVVNVSLTGGSGTLSFASVNLWFAPTEGLSSEGILGSINTLPSAAVQIGGVISPGLIQFVAARLYNVGGSPAEGVLGVSLRKADGSGSSAFGTPADPIRVDPTGGTTQPISGTVTANIGTSGSLALDATLTGGNQKAVARGGAKGSTNAADVTSTAEGADHQALDVQVYHGGAAVNPTAIRALTASDVVSAEINDWLGSTAPTVGQKSMANSIPVAFASDQTGLPAPTSSTATLSNVTASATNVTLLSANTSRKGATIHNDSTSVAYVKLGTTASSSSFTVRMPAQGYYEVPFGYTGRIDALWASADGSARVTELT